MIRETESLTSMMGNISKWFSFIYEALAVYLSLCLIWMGSMMLERVIDQLPTDLTPSYRELGKQLRKWERTFGLIKDYIENINSYLGVILLITVGKAIFVVNINIYFLIKSMSLSAEYPLPVDCLTLIIRNTFNFILIIFVCHGIQRKVSSDHHNQEINRSITVYDLQGSQSMPALTDTRFR